MFLVRCFMKLSVVRMCPSFDIRSGWESKCNFFVDVLTLRYCLYTYITEKQCRFGHFEIYFCHTSESASSVTNCLYFKLLYSCQTHLHLPGSLETPIVSSFSPLLAIRSLCTCMHALPLKLVKYNPTYI